MLIAWVYCHVYLVIVIIRRLISFVVGSLEFSDLILVNAILIDLKDQVEYKTQPLMTGKVCRNRNFVV